MTKGTILRMVLSILAIIFIMLMVFDVINISLLMKTVTSVVCVGILTIGFYFNEDFSEEACIGTGLTRLKKASKKADYAGEDFFVEFDGEEIEDEQDDI